MASKSTTHVPADDLRRFATALGVAAGLTPGRASTLAGLSLWYDEAGRPDLGLAALPDWLDRLISGELDPRAEGEVARPEPASAATIDGSRALPHLILDRAALIASEKARESGIGLVRVVRLAGPAPSAAVAAGLAVGPSAGLILGPDRGFSLAIPTAGGPPIVYDSGPASGPERPPIESAPALSIALRALVAEGDALVLSASVSALFGPVAPSEIRPAGRSLGEASKGLLLPEDREARRLKVLEEGLPVPRAARDRLRGLADRLGVAPPWKR